MGERFYPVRQGRLGLYILFGLVAFPLIAAILVMGVTGPAQMMLLVVVCGFIVLFYASAFRIRYEVDNQEIRFRQGFFATWRIPISQISRVAPAQGAAGVSFTKIDCLLVEAGNRHRLVAAPDQETFIKELAARAPHLRRYGQELRGTI